MTFLFDIGKVLIDFDFESSLRRLLPADSPDADERLAKMLDRKDEFESGRIELEDYIPWALDILGPGIPRDAFIDAWRRIFTPNLPMWRTVEELHGSGHQLILFSNTNPIHCPWIFDEYEILRRFHAAVLSFETGSIKPHDSIYQHAIEAHGLIPRETLYIDDLSANISTGRRLGFRSFQYDLNDHPSFESWLAGELATGDRPA